MSTTKIKVAVLPDSLMTAKKYKVIEVENSIRYTPGEVLDERAVGEIAASRWWDLTVVSA